MRGRHRDLFRAQRCIDIANDAHNLAFLIQERCSMHCLIGKIGNKVKARGVIIYFATGTEIKCIFSDATRLNDSQIGLIAAYHHTMVTQVGFFFF